MPVYNGEKFIRDAIDSVLSQTYKDFEFIIVDDGSQDLTVNIIKNEYKDNRINLIHQKNSGPAAARNVGMSEAKGDYFAFIDCDDLYIPSKIEEQINVFNKNPMIDVVWNDFIVVDEKLNEMMTIRAEYSSDKREDLLAFMLFRNVITIPPSIMIRRKCFDEGYKYDEGLIHDEDYDLLLRMLEKYNFYYLDKVIYIYRRHKNNLTNDKKKMEDAENRIINKYSEEKIKEIVDASSFDDYEKKLLMSKICLKQKKLDQALLFLEGIKNSQKSSLVYFYMGNINYMLGDYRKSKENFEMAINRKPDMAEAYNNLGCCMASLNINNYKSMFEKALEIESEYMDPQINMKNIESRNCNFRITTRELRKVIKNYQ
jgi:glycosyltransferase involved in cell wall biosynthesis